MEQRSVVLSVGNLLKVNTGRPAFDPLAGNYYFHAGKKRSRYSAQKPICFKGC